MTTRLIGHFNAQRVTAIVGGKPCKLKSKLEHRLALYLELLRSKGFIKDWAYEQTTFTFKDDTRGAGTWLIDFDIINPDGSFAYFEGKGQIKSSDRTKFRRLSRYRPDAQVTLVLSHWPTDGKQISRARAIEEMGYRVVTATDLFRGIV